MTSLADRLRDALRARGLDWPAPIEHHVRLGSTSDRLKEKARKGAPEWAAVLADEQTGGRGRQGRAWASPPGGLYLSVLLRPRFAPASLIPLAAGVAVVEALGEHGVTAELKWPNDVLAGGAAGGPESNRGLGPRADGRPPGAGGGRGCGPGPTDRLV